jgi:hypothetical protein
MKLCGYNIYNKLYACVHSTRKVRAVCVYLLYVKLVLNIFFKDPKRNTLHLLPIGSFRVICLFISVNTSLTGKVQCTVQ